MYCNAYGSFGRGIQPVSYTHLDVYKRQEMIMPLVTSKEMLSKAQKEGYAVGAFNAENMEMVKAIIEAAEELEAPVMIQTTPSTVKYGTVETYAAPVSYTHLDVYKRQAQDCHADGKASKRKKCI